MLHLQDEVETLNRAMVSENVYHRRAHTDVTDIDRRQAWYVYAEDLCVTAILECVLRGEHVPQFGKDETEWWKMRDFLPAVLQPFMHSKMNVEQLGQTRHAIRCAYEYAYKRVQGFFPWLEQNSVQVT